MASRKTTLQEEQLTRACEIANQIPDVREIEQEFGALTDPIAEPWEDAPADPDPR